MTKHYSNWEPIHEINPKDSALLIIDMQNAFLEEGAVLEVPMARKQIPTFKKLIAYCRDTGVPIIYTTFYVDPNAHYKFFWNIADQRGLKVKDPDCEMRDGNHETKIFSEIKPSSSEKVIKKYGYDCFAETMLEVELQKMNTKNIIITGTVLNWCVDSTVRAAYHKHYDVTVIADAVSAYDHAGGSADQWHQMELNFFAEAFGRVVSADEAIEEMENLY